MMISILVLMVLASFTPSLEDGKLSGRQLKELVPNDFVTFA